MVKSGTQSLQPGDQRTDCILDGHKLHIFLNYEIFTLVRMQGYDSSDSYIFLEPGDHDF